MQPTVRISGSGTSAGAWMGSGRARARAMVVSDLPNRERTYAESNGVARPAEPAFPQYRPISAELALALSVSVVIPVKNEAANLPHVFPVIPDWIDEVVLVDGRSTDNTLEVARRLRPDIKIVPQKGAGKGDALLAGFAACSGDIIVAMDGDGSTHGSEIIHFVSALVAGADFVKGSRFASGGRSDDITVGRRCGNRLLLTLVNRMYGTRYSDLCYGYNAFWSRHLDALGIECDGFEVETLMSIRAAKAGLRIHEVPSHERPRLNGTSNLRAIRDGWRILRVILREKFRRPSRCTPRYPAATGVGYLEPVRIAAADAKTDVDLESL
jgi:glycosyltransferase involved in cell wall biosynthesis